MVSRGINAETDAVLRSLRASKKPGLERDSHRAHVPPPLHSPAFLHPLWIFDSLCTLVTIKAIKSIYVQKCVNDYVDFLVILLLKNIGSLKRKLQQAGAGSAILVMVEGLYVACSLGCPVAPCRTARYDLASNEVGAAPVPNVCFTKTRNSHAATDRLLLLK